MAMWLLRDALVSSLPESYLARRRTRRPLLSDIAGSRPAIGS
jgi:hypothetical protein